MSCGDGGVGFQINGGRLGRARTGVGNGSGGAIIKEENAEKPGAHIVSLREDCAYFKARL